MARDVIIGLDAGTSVIKAVAFDGDGAPLAEAATPNRTIPVAEGGVEQDATETWIGAAKTLRSLADKLAAANARVVALAITGQGDGTWLIDRDGDPVAPAWLWLDGRAGAIVDRLRRSEIGPRIQHLTGTALNASLQSGQLLWLLAHRPEVLARAATAFHCKDWLYFKLVGERATDVAEGTFTFGDYRTRRYAPEVLELLGLAGAARLLPDMIDGTKHVGRLTPAAARATGLPPGLPVALAPLDVLCTALGAGIYDQTASVGCTIIGSAGIHMRLFRSAEEVVLGNQVGYTMPFVVPGTWVGMMSNMAATLNIDWLLGWAEQLVAAAGLDPPPRRELLALFDRKAGQATPGALLFHPFICEAGERGPFVEPLARAQLFGLSTRNTVFDLMRAIYEALGFAARDCHEALGHRPDEVRVAGGAMRSTVIRAILGATLGVPISVAEREEAGAAGAAMVAAVALGHHASIAAACPVWVDRWRGHAEAPDPALARAYDRLFPCYRLAYRPSPELWRALDEARRATLETAGASECLI